MKTKTLGIWGIALVIAGALGANAFANEEVETRDSIRMRFEATVSFEQKWTKVPAIACSPEMRRTGRCPRPQPYHVLMLKLTTPKRGIDMVQASSTQIGVLKKPQTMTLGDLEVREGDIVDVSARVRRFFNTGYVKRIYNARFVGRLPGHGVDLGSGYSCFLRDRMDVTYNQMSVALVNLRSNRFDGTTYGRLIADSTMRFPTRNILDLDIMMEDINERRVGSVAKRVTDRDGIVRMSIRGALVPGAKLRADAVINLRGRTLQLKGECEFKSNVVRRRDF